MNDRFGRKAQIGDMTASRVEQPLEGQHWKIGDRPLLLAGSRSLCLASNFRFGRHPANQYHIGE